MLVLAVVTPVVTAGWWVVTGAGDPLERRDPVLLPAFVAAEGAAPPRPRTLVLRTRPDGTLTYAWSAFQRAAHGHAELTPGPGGPRRTGRRGRRPRPPAAAATPRPALVPYGVRFVLLTPPVDRKLARAIDTVPGCCGSVGRAARCSGRSTTRPAGSGCSPANAPVVEDDGAPPPAKVLPAGQVESHAEIAAGPAGRLLVLADAASPAWRASVDGTSLTPRRYDGWARRPSSCRRPVGGST